MVSPLITPNEPFCNTHSIVTRAGASQSQPDDSFNNTFHVPFQKGQLDNYTLYKIIIPNEAFQKVTATAFPHIVLGIT